MWILLQPDEDGNPVRVLDDDELQELLDNPEEHGIQRFLDGEFLDINTDANYWHEGDAILLKAEVVIPQPSGKMRLP